MCTTCSDINNSFPQRPPPPQCIYKFRWFLTVESRPFGNNISQLVFLAQRQFVFCETGKGFLKYIF